MICVKYIKLICIQNVKFYVHFPPNRFVLLQAFIDVVCISILYVPKPSFALLLGHNEFKFHMDYFQWNGMGTLPS